MQPPEVYTFPNRYFQYEGIWQTDEKGQYTGVKQGPGVLQLGDATRIKANFIDGEMQGEVDIEWGDGRTYSGNVINGVRTGDGTYEDPDNGISYEGEWLNNTFHGEGIYKSPTETYEGQFRQHKYSQHGRLDLVDGTKYVGQFLDGLYEGEGELITGSKREPLGLGGGQIKYEGQFRVGAREGLGRAECLISRLSFDGEWQDDLPIHKGEDFDLVDDTGASLLPPRPKPPSSPGDGDDAPVEAEPPPPPPPCVLNEETVPTRWTLKVLDTDGKEVFEEGNRAVYCALYKCDEESVKGTEDGSVKDTKQLPVLELRSTMDGGDMEVSWKACPPPGSYVFEVEDISPEPKYNQEVLIWKKLATIKLQLTVEDLTTPVAKKK